MSNGTQQASQFNLKSDTITVAFVRTTDSGVPHFSYRDANREISRSGDEIRIADVEFGTLVTIDVEAAPDDERESFSLVLPTINFGSDDSRVVLQAIGIRTINHTTVFAPGPLLGGGKTYETFHLHGVARS